MPTQEHQLPTVQNDIMATLQSLISPQQSTVAGSDPTTQILLQVTNTTSCCSITYMSHSINGSQHQIQSLLPTLSPAQAAPIQQYLAQILPTATAPTPSPGMLHANLPRQDQPNIGSPIMRDRSTTPTGTPPPISGPPPPTSNMNTAALMKNLTSLGLLGGGVSAQPTNDHSKSMPGGILTDFGPFRLDSKDIQM